MTEAEFLVTFTLPIDQAKLLEEVLSVASSEGPYSREDDVVALLRVIQSALGCLPPEFKVKA